MLLATLMPGGLVKIGLLGGAVPQWVLWLAFAPMLVAGSVCLWHQVQMEQCNTAIEARTEYKYAWRTHRSVMAHPQRAQETDQ